jgi:hypothetical protein
MVSHLRGFDYTASLFACLVQIGICVCIICTTDITSMLVAAHCDVFRCF